MSPGRTSPERMDAAPDIATARSVGALLAATVSALGSDPQARWVLSHVSRRPVEGLLPAADEEVPPRLASEVAAVVARLRAGEPLQYVLGTWAFRALEVRVDPRVLVPRPETEQVAGYALEELSRAWAAERGGQPHAADPCGRVVAVDLGTGSGVIALSLAAESRPAGGRPLEVWATDASEEALEVTRANLALLERAEPAAAARVRIARGDWLSALPASLAGRIHLIVSNPPYVSAPEWRQLPPVVRDHEPPGALVAGRTGLEALTLIVRAAPRWLVPGGSVVLELAPAQAGAVADEARRAGLCDVEVRPDLAGLPRALVAHRGTRP